MSVLNPLSIYPTLKGLDYPITRIPIMKTSIQESRSGKESSVSFWSYPRWTLKLKYNYLTQADYTQIVNFFLAQKGKAIPFWFEDLNNNYLAPRIIGVADGTTTSFQITRLAGNMQEPIFGTKSNMIVLSSQSGATYNINAGSVVFNTAPLLATGNIVVSGGYYHRVRFDKDELEVDEFMKNLYELQTVELITVK